MSIVVAIICLACLFAGLVFGFFSGWIAADGYKGKRTCRDCLRTRAEYGFVSDGVTYRCVRACLAFALVASMTGCLNVSVHANGKVPCVYPGTILGLEMCGYHPPCIIPMIIDLPLEIVADTITLPYDAFTAR